VSKPAPFLAIDGEAMEDDYALLACSNGSTVTNLEKGGLSSSQCFKFLATLPKRHTPVCFGLGYDVNNWLRDLPRNALEKLWADNHCYWNDWRIEWIPGCWFKLKHVHGASVTVHEVFRFFQMSFVKSLEAWEIGQPAEIARMKGERGTFRRKDVDAVTRYCLKECELLVELMNQLRTVCREVNMVPRKWIGAGALAATLLNREGIEQHHAYDLDIATESVAEDIILGAYFAGRIELLHQGIHSRVRTVDIRSAYPAATLDLPSLDGAKLVHRKRFDPSKHGIWRVTWDLRANPPLISPFPTRQKMSIYWPAAGSGWYHAVEVQAAIECGYPVEVHEGWVLHESGERPFSWIKPLFAERQRLKREGHAAEKVVKLGLNSIYGKLAQGYGFNSRPRWQCYFWAGYITAATRAKVLRAASKSKGIIMISTDGIFCKQPGVRPGANLGGWEFGDVDRLFAAQAGVYQGITPNKEILKSRGFFAGEVDYDELREGWELEGADYVHHYDSNRFIGLGVALMRKDFSVWRQWRTERRALMLNSERKVLGDNGILTPFPGPLDSEPYTPKLSLIEGRALDQLQGMDQPMKEAI
jgi:DNA polymerase type B, organellar and viral